MILQLYLSWSLLWRGLGHVDGHRGVHHLDLRCPANEKVSISEEARCPMRGCSRYCDGPFLEGLTYHQSSLLGFAGKVWPHLHLLHHTRRRGSIDHQKHFLSEYLPSPPPLHPQMAKTRTSLLALHPRQLLEVQGCPEDHTHPLAPTRPAHPWSCFSAGLAPSIANASQASCSQFLHSSGAS